VSDDLRDKSLLRGRITRDLSAPSPQNKTFHPSLSGPLTVSAPITVPYGTAEAIARLGMVTRPFMMPTRPLVMNRAKFDPRSCSALLTQPAARRLQEPYKLRLPTCTSMRVAT
jgi:hypothetical protein